MRTSTFEYCSFCEFGVVGLDNKSFQPLHENFQKVGCESHGIGVTPYEMDEVVIKFNASLPCLLDVKR